MMNKRPTNALKTNVLAHNPLLHVSTLHRRHLQCVLYEPAELLPNVVKAKWDEGCIL
jgi:hypothetical protein